MPTTTARRAPRRPRMPDAAVGALLLAAALLLSLLGMAWLALSLEAHWRQVRGPAAAPRGAVRALRSLGSVALLGALGLCWQADHPTMAPLVWVMSLAAAA